MTPPRAALSDLDSEVLLTLVWAAPLLTEHLRSILALSSSRRQFQRRLARLEGLGLVEGDFFYRRPTKTTPRPVRIGKLWSTTERGRAVIADHARAPPKAADPLRKALLNHDSSVAAVIAHVIAQTRPILSGVAVFRETRVDELRPKPIADTIVVVRTRGDAAYPFAIPWSNQGRQPDEAIRVIAIESDRGTEELGVIADKALAYQKLPEDQSFLDRYHGVMPMPVWVAPKTGRLRSIHRVWREQWPDGSWLRATDAELRLSQFIEYQDGRERERTWLDDWDTAVRDVCAATEEEA